MKKINIIILIAMLWSLGLQAQQSSSLKGVVVTGYDRSKMEDRTFKYKPTGNTKDLFMSIENIAAKLTIIGSDKSDIELQVKDLLGLPKKAEGLKAISKYGEDNTKMEINLSQSGNEIKLVGTSVKRTKLAEYTIVVPKHITLTIVNIDWGDKDVKVKKIKGGVEVIVGSSNVKLEEVTGPLSISSNSGNIEVVYDDISSEAVTVFSTSSGDIDLTFPSSSNIDFKITQANGEVFTDLDVAFTIVKSYEEKQKDVKLSNSPPKPTYPNQLSSARSLINSPASYKAQLNDGGTRIDIVTIAGDVYLRKK